MGALMTDAIDRVLMEADADRPAETASARMGWILDRRVSIEPDHDIPAIDFRGQPLWYVVQMTVEDVVAPT
jgi:hypothetical protein